MNPTKSQITFKQLFLLLPLMALIATMSAFGIGEETVLVLGLGVTIVMAYYWTETVFYLMIALTPFIYWQFTAGSFNAPYGDLLAILTFTALSLKILKEKKLNLELFKTPVLIPFLIFFVAAGLSIINAETPLLSLKYLLRPLLFFYLMYVAMPFFIIKDKKILGRVITIFYSTGIAIALMGAYSLLFPVNASGLFRRAMPISIFGLYPLGTNHNLIAECLVAVFPVGFILIEKAKTESVKRALIVLQVFIGSINLMTLSRAGWLSISLELLLLALLFFRINFKKLMKTIGYSLIIIIPLAIGMWVFNQSKIASSSNTNRLMMIEIAVEAWKLHPIIGNGLNSFSTFASQNMVYIIEFGSAEEAHGFNQKLLTETGLLGVLAYWILIISILRQLAKGYMNAKSNEDQKILAAMIAMVAAVFFFQLFNTSYFVGKLWLPVGIALSAQNLISNKNKNKEL